MKISVNDVELYTITPAQIQVLHDVISSEAFDADMKARLLWVFTQKYDEALRKLRNEWGQKLRENGVANAPTDDAAFALLVFQQPNYKDKATRDEEEGM